jgi:Thioredoxin-like
MSMSGPHTMRRSPRWGALALLAALAALGAGGPEMSTPAGYDAARDPAADLRQAEADAAGSGRRIVLEIGGEWCIWCHRFERFFADHPDLRRSWDAAFVTVKVNYSKEQKNEGFLADYPPVPGYPHLFVLDADGTFLASQDTDELESGKGYSADAVRRFLASWAPPARRDSPPAATGSHS